MKHSRRWFGLGSCGLLLLALAPGCGSNSGPAPISFAALPGQFADAWCDNIGGCCQAAAIGFDLAGCKQTAIATISAELAPEDNPNIRYDPAAAGRCVAAYASAAQSCKDDGSLDTVCKDVFRGTLPAGAACITDGECARSVNADAYCAGADQSGTTSAQGVCTVDTGVLAGAHGKLGDACQGTCGLDGDCTGSAADGNVPITETTSCFAADGLQCGAAMQTCQPLIALGGACSGEDCAVGTACINGVCSKPQADGTACLTNTDCAGGACVYGTNSIDTGTCGERILANAQTCTGEL